MPEAISDTSPIQYLFQSETFDLLPNLYRKVLVPQGVASELEAGREAGVFLPDLDEIEWIEIVSSPYESVLPLAVDLGPGEREVLALATERSDAVALLDDGLARHFAKLLRIRFTGTLGVLLKAKSRGHLDLVEPILDRLQVLGFHLDSATRAAVLEVAGEAQH